MTVQELINQLQQIEDKTQPVFVYDYHNGRNQIEGIDSGIEDDKDCIDINFNLPF